MDLQRFLSAYKYYKRSSPAKELKQAEEHSFSIPIAKDIEMTKYLLEETFSTANDFVIRNIKLSTHSGILVYLDGLVNTMTISEHIIKPLFAAQDLKLNEKQPLTHIKESFLIASQIQEKDTYADAIEAVLQGNTVLFLDKIPQCLIIDTSEFDYRGVQEPATEMVVRGPREGFTESLLTNMTLLRRKINNPKLKSEQFSIGTNTNTKVLLIYLENLVDPLVLQEARKRLRSIKIDSVLESGYIEELIEDAPTSPFPTIGNTEKPDIAAGKILEGKLVILTDGTPIALTLPYTLVETLQVPEDYYSRAYYASFIRTIRFVCLLISLFLPGLYIAISTFHAEMIPTDLLVTMVAAREGIPWPVVVEVFLIWIIYEILREASIRMPKPMGSAVSIVGALVLGQAAIQAGITSPIVVIIVSTTAIAGLVLPSQTDALGLLRLPFVFLGALFGFYGIMWGSLLLLTHMTSLKSFGTPYTEPFAPLDTIRLRDTFVRFPWWFMPNRPGNLKISRRSTSLNKALEGKEDD